MSLTHSFDDPRQILLREPVEVWFEGWRSDTRTLMTNGWDISVDHSPYDRQMRFAFRNRTLQLYGLSDFWDMLDFAQSRMNPTTYFPEHGQMSATMMNQAMEEMRYRQGRAAIRISQCLGKDIMVHHMDAANFVPLKDPHLYMKVSDVSRRMISEMPWFETAEVSAQNLFFEGHEVPDLMQMILDKQKDKQAEIREKLRKAEKAGERMPEMKVQSKIIQLVR